MTNENVHEIKNLVLAHTKILQRLCNMMNEAPCRIYSDDLAYPEITNLIQDAIVAEVQTIQDLNKEIIEASK
jgi:hypothetical protein